MGTIFPAGRSADAILHQPIRDHLRAVAFKELPVDAPHHIRLGGDDLVGSRLVAPPVAKEGGEVDPPSAFLEAEAYAHADVLGDGRRLLLCDGREDRDHQLPRRLPACSRIPFSKDDGDVQGFQLPDVVQRIQRIPCEAGNRLCDHKIDVPVLACFDHGVELRSGLRLRAGETFVRENPRQLPVVMGLYEIRVVRDLRLVGTFLFLRVRGHAAVGRRLRDLWAWDHGVCILL